MFLIFKLLKYVFFIIHIVFIITTIIGPFFYKNIVFFQLLVIVSWKYYNNNCILTILEDTLFNETLLTYFGYKNNKYTRFRVPVYHRIFIYLLFLYNLITKFLKIF